ncbi:methionine ABC transporter ATP-binding protein [Caldibacillus thermolactis]|jgi:D-methionine transport system ATP-binding protein|uniref:Methionine ABC transporter ATP-binding protein n=1 Tax=Pallidibacillus thermolactis TaxID=251051 RepID=A0ABT2WIK5_9BACI|nr:methionine ABC transporter ATP-binding protein [Pallidibacillus thermolactis]MCU9595522.1 methionine ABC transporter ATP-binding protein [Pallidibacillus thermolactis]MCU9601797.1 methionine ABC transporter ATP-binding protein [Pallidibacillus thermolactis subsp. kokeshiiformis]MED1674534.1 methionine ABC transporter ATP-binding protein [Pallidibacillus thermolactis subsp. kokeshiiformis]
MIQIQHLTKRYKNTTAIRNINLTINQGEIFGIIGYSGAGKSTLLNCLNLLEKPTEGKIIVDEEDITVLSEKEIRKRRQKIGTIFQHFHLISAKTVFDNVAFSLKAAGKSKEEIHFKVPKLLKLVGLQDKANNYPAQLSGGQKQRVGIARALANDPKVLLCDEATSALDPTTTDSILHLLKEINRNLGLTIVIITHEMEVVQKICDRVAVMEAGEIVELGAVYDIFSAPKHPLTKEFVQSVQSFTLPDRLLQERKGTIVKITFRGDSAENPIISETLAHYPIMINILHGQISYINDKPLGTLIIEAIGKKSDIDAAIRFISERTKQLEVLADVA